MLRAGLMRWRLIDGGRCGGQGCQVTPQDPAGWEHGWSEASLTSAPAAKGAGRADEITIQRAARVGQSFYKGQADWAAIAEVKTGGADSGPHANGDINQQQVCGRGAWRLSADRLSMVGACCTGPAVVSLPVSRMICFVQPCTTQFRRVWILVAKW